jgi:excisionase family DNA binding protein
MDKNTLTISEASTLLGLHKNTIRNRIKDGTLQAEKVGTERGLTWMIDRDSLNNLNNTTLPSASQVIVNADVRVALQSVLEPFVKDLGDVREELGRERERREQLQRRLAELEEEPQGAPESTIREQGDRLLLELEEERAERHRLQLELEAVYEREREEMRPW